MTSSFSYPAYFTTWEIFLRRPFTILVIDSQQRKQGKITATTTIATARDWEAWTTFWICGGFQTLHKWRSSLGSGYGEGKVKMDKITFSFQLHAKQSHFPTLAVPSFGQLRWNEILASETENRCGLVLRWSYSYCPKIRLSWAALPLKTCATS